MNSPSRVLAIRFILGQKSKSQGHKVQKIFQARVCNLLTGHVYCELH